MSPDPFYESPYCSINKRHRRAITCPGCGDWVVDNRQDNCPKCGENWTNIHNKGARNQRSLGTGSDLD